MTMLYVSNGFVSVPAFEFPAYVNAYCPIDVRLDAVVLAELLLVATTIL